MKMRLDHIVPLSKQAVSVLEEIHMHARRGRYGFPCARGANRALSENVVRTALRTMRYSNGYFRAMARTLLDEVLGYREDWIEYQLTHAVKDPNTLSENPWLQSEADRNSLSFQIQRYL